MSTLPSHVDHRLTKTVAAEYNKPETDEESERGMDPLHGTHSVSWNERAEEIADTMYRRFIPARKQQRKRGFIYPHLSWPTSEIPQKFPIKHYWWNAHFIDCMIDQAVRKRTLERLEPAQRAALSTPIVPVETIQVTSAEQPDHLPTTSFSSNDVVDRIQRLVRTLYCRNYCGIVNEYYDDMAWMALALQRGQNLLQCNYRKLLRVLDKEFEQAWLPQWGGGVRWRKEPHEYFFNSPTAGSVGIHSLRSGNIGRAEEISDWVHEHLYDPDEHCIWDGKKVEVHADSTYQYTDVTKDIYTYNQGLILALEWGLYCHGSYAGRNHFRSVTITHLIHTIDATLCDTQGVLRGHGGEDGGLFAGILARYLAEFVCTVCESDTEFIDAAQIARRIVMSSASAAYNLAYHDEIGRLCNEEWSQPGNKDSCGHLSVQTGAWMLIEAAAAIERNETLGI